MSFHFESTRTARKPHRCAGCRTAINAGEQYLYIAGKWDGDFGAMSYHQSCRAAEIKVNRESDLYGDEWEFLHDHVADGGVAVLEGCPEEVKARFARHQEPDDAR